MSQTEVLFDVNQAGAQNLSQCSGLIFSFLPAHGGSKATEMIRGLCRTVAKDLELRVLLAQFDAPDAESGRCSVWRTADAPRRLDGHTWGAFVASGECGDELDAREVHPRQLRGVLEYAASHYHLVCADLTGAKEAHATEVLRSSESIFVVSGSGAGSLEIVREKAAWLRSIDLAARCVLLLRTEAGGASPAEAEARTGLRVAGLIESGPDLRHLAQWLGSGEEEAR
jgi:hypothetical protein